MINKISVEDIPPHCPITAEDLGCMTDQNISRLLRKITEANNMLEIIDINNEISEIVRGFKHEILTYCN